MCAKGLLYAVRDSFFFFLVRGGGGQFCARCVRFQFVCFVSPSSSSKLFIHRGGTPRKQKLKSCFLGPGAIKYFAKKPLEGHNRVLRAAPAARNSVF